MPKFKYFGLASVKGAQFFVTAPDEAAARRRAANGDYDEVELGKGQVVDAEIKLGSCETVG